MRVSLPAHSRKELAERTTLSAVESNLLNMNSRPRRATRRGPNIGGREHASAMQFLSPGRYSIEYSIGISCARRHAVTRPLVEFLTHFSDTWSTRATSGATDASTYGALSATPQKCASAS